MTHDFQNDPHAANDGADEPEGASGGEKVAPAGNGDAAFRVLTFHLCVQGRHAHDEDGEGDFDTEYFPENMRFFDDDAANAAAMNSLKVDVAASLKPIAEYLASLGCIRADWNNDCDPVFWLLMATDGEQADPLPLLSFTQEIGDLGALANARIFTTPPVELMAAEMFQMLREGEVGASVHPWCAIDTPGLLPCPEETFEEWTDRVAVRPDRVRRNLTRWRTSNGNVELFAMCGDASERSSGEQGIEWVGAQGLLLRSAVTLLAGNNESGKSTFCAELAAKLGSELEGPHQLLGVEVSGGSVVVQFSGEDSDGVMNARSAVHAVAYGKSNGFTINGARHSFEKCLAWIREMPVVDVVIFDPVRKFLAGDEDSSDVANRFYGELEKLASEKNCAVLVVHHLRKNANPRRLQDINPQIRGSGVHTDRPRMSMGMIYHGGDVAEVGITKTNLPPSEKLWAPRMAGRRFRREASTITLEPIDAVAPRAEVAADQPPGLGPRILAALAGMSEAGRCVHRTGKSSLYECRLPELAGISRKVIGDEIDALIDAGAVIVTEAGLKLKRSIS